MKEGRDHKRADDLRADRPAPEILGITVVHPHNECVHSGRTVNIPAHKRRATNPTYHYRVLRCEACHAEYVSPLWL